MSIKRMLLSGAYVLEEVGGLCIWRDPFPFTLGLAGGRGARSRFASR